MAVLLLDDDNFFRILFRPLSFSLVCGEHSANSFLFRRGNPQNLFARPNARASICFQSVAVAGCVSLAPKAWPVGSDICGYATQPVAFDIARTLRSAYNGNACQPRPRIGRGQYIPIGSPPGGMVPEDDVNFLGNFAEVLHFNRHSNVRKPKNAWT